MRQLPRFFCIMQGVENSAYHATSAYYKGCKEDPFFVTEALARYLSDTNYLDASLLL